MKKLTLLVALAMMAVMPMSAEVDCLFTDDLLPGQPSIRFDYDIEATIPVGTAVQTRAAFVYDMVSSDPEVISVTNEGNGQKITFLALKAGTAVVSYRQMGNNGKEDCYTNHSVSYTVTKIDPTAQFKFNGDIVTEASMYLNDYNPGLTTEFFMPTPFLQDGKICTLNKQVPASEIQYESTNPGIAYMNASGKLQLVAKGKTTITASWAGNESWNPIQIKIDIYVSEPLYLRVAGKRVTSYNMDDILGDGKAEYDSLNHTLTLHGVNWDFSDHDIDTKYGAIEYWGPSDTFLIVLDGVNTIINAPLGINTKEHDRETDLGENDLIFRSINNGTLRCSGDHSQIISDYFTLEENANIQISCNSRWEKAVETYGMWVDDGCKVVISSKGERGVAADVYYLSLGEHVYLQGCHFVPYENYSSPYGFYIDDENTEEAWMVAILSEIVDGYGEADTPDDDKETVINISNTETASDENAEDIAMISLGEEDQYNEEKQQLEISTTLTDKEVEDALSLFGPGANALKYMLPGSISFFIPAGKGSIQIECQTFLGALKLKLEGLPAYALSQAVMGWAKVDYDVEVDTYVIIYLNSGIHLASAHIVAAHQDTPITEMAGVYIKGIKVTPAAVAPTGIESVSHESVTNSQKILENGQLVIISDGVKYNAQGVMMR